MVIQTFNLWLDFVDDSVIVLIEHSLARPFESRLKPPARASLTAKQQRIILLIGRRTGSLISNFLQASKELLPGGDVSLFHVQGASESFYGEDWGRQTWDWLAGFR
jgi:hypothetical protein